MKKYPTQTELKECFEIRIQDGIETLWRKATKRSKECAIKDSSQGISLKNKSYSTHIIKFILVNGDILNRNSIIIHKDGNKLNNQSNNLEMISARTFFQKICDKECGKEGCSGAYLQNNRWFSVIVINKKCIGLGGYDTKEEASAVYFKACELEGQFKNPRQFRSLLGIKEYRNSAKGVGVKNERFESRITINRRSVYIGSFKTWQEAYQHFVKAKNLKQHFNGNIK